MRELAVLARVMRDLTALDESNRQKREAGRSNDEPIPTDIDELRASLSRKLEGLVASQQGEAPPKITNNESRAFDTWWDVFAHSHQRPPDGDWATWLILGGRGAGKTRAGAEWVRELALRHANAGIALVGETEHDAREVMVEGICGVLAVHRRDERPE